MTFCIGLSTQAQQDTFLQPMHNGSYKALQFLFKDFVHHLNHICILVNAVFNSYFTVLQPLIHHYSRFCSERLHKTTNARKSRDHQHRCVKAREPSRLLVISQRWVSLPSALSPSEWLWSASQSQRSSKSAASAQALCFGGTRLGPGLPSRTSLRLFRVVRSPAVKS